MPILQLAILFAAAMIAGALNSVAGGGSFITFPTLISVGVPSIEANVTNTVALWTGTVASVGAYRAELDAQRRILLPLCGISLVGGLVGAYILLHTPPQTFDRLVPFLLLFATLVFAFSGPLTKRLRERNAAKNPPETAIVGRRGPSPLTLIAISVLQFMVAAYGGFFGAGIGLMMLGVLALMGMENIHAMNALKTLLASCINGVAVITFVIAGRVWWPQAIVMTIGAIIGGYGGATYAKRVNPILIRYFVIGIGCFLSIYYFVHQ